MLSMCFSSGPIKRGGVMKYRAFCDFPANDRGVYVEANTPNEAEKIIRGVVALIYAVEPEMVSFYNLDSEIDNPEGVLKRETGWKGAEAVAWDENPLVLYPGNQN